MSLSVDISKKYKNFSLSIKFETDGATIGILGASGCGKSLTLKSIAGIVTPDSGRIVLNGRVLFDSKEKINLPPQKRKVGYLFQNYALFPSMTVEENIGAGIHDKVKKKEIIKEMIKTFSLTGLEKQYPGRLSGGQQQRVALARILASDAEVLLLDEPFSALDYYLKEQLKEQLLELIKNYRKDVIKNYRKDVILVTHDREEAFSLCPNLIIMEKGQLVTQGKLKDIFEVPEYLAAARLTGCKNISKAIKISDHVIYASDWNMNLNIEQIVEDDIKYVGIRAHYLHALKHDSQKVNLIEPELIEVMDSPFEVNVIFRNNKVNRNELIENKQDLLIKNQEKIEEYEKVEDTLTSENRIWWKLTKEQWYEEYNSTLPNYIAFPSNKILLLKE